MPLPTAEDHLAELQDLAHKLRVHSVKMTTASKSSHPTSCLRGSTPVLAGSWVTSYPPLGLGYTMYLRWQYNILVCLGKVNLMRNVKVNFVS